MSLSTFQAKIRTCRMSRTLYVLPGVQLGMDRTEVIRVLETSPYRNSLMNSGEGLTLCIKDSPFFRHADCSFDTEEKLTGITLTIREVVDLERALHHLRVAYRLQWESRKERANDGVTVVVKGDKVMICDPGRATGNTRSARGPDR